MLQRMTVNTWEKSIFETECKIAHGLFPHLILPVPQWSNLLADSLFSQTPLASLQRTSLLQRCRRHNAAKLNLLMLKSIRNNKSWINTGSWNRCRPDKSPGNRRIPLADWQRFVVAGGRSCPLYELGGWKVLEVASMARTLAIRSWVILDCTEDTMDEDTALSFSWDPPLEWARLEAGLADGDKTLLGDG